MKRNDNILRYVSDELSAEELRAFQDALSSDLELQREVHFAERFLSMSRGAVSDETDRRLDPFFADRLMKVVSGAALQKSTQEEFLRGLVRWFSPVTAVSLVIIVVLLAGSFSGRSHSGSVADSVLGLPAVTIANVYDLDYE